jgi:phosphoglycerol transferase MdoB-like AlkP superfamily enzyme
MMFGDHNTYYQGLSNYVKDIYSYDDENYTNLYRVPMMIYDEKLVNAMENNNDSRMVNKFTTTYDLVPTLLDLMGVKYYTNFYFGHSIFEEQESVLYSRAYNIFLRDNLYLYSMNNILYKGENVTNNDIEVFEEEAKILLNKLSHIDRIFYNDFFSRNGKKDTYIKNVKLINEK